PSPSCARGSAGLVLNVPDYLAEVTALLESSPALTDPELPVLACAGSSRDQAGVAHSWGNGLGFLRRQISGGSAARFGRSLYLLQTTTIHIVDIAVDRDARRYERMLANTPYVLKHARRLICDCMPFDEMASSMAAAVMRIRPFLAIECGGSEIILKQIGHD